MMFWHDYYVIKYKNQKKAPNYFLSLYKTKLWI